jgi:hypothetical protein
MDDTVQKFRDRKTSKIETLFQILQVIWQGNLNESDERTTLEQYVSHIELIDRQHKLAGQQGESTTGTRQGGREQTHDMEPERHTYQRGAGPEIQDAEHFLRVLQKELVRKRKHQNCLVSSQSSEESDDEQGEGETNKKKRVYQLQLPWYATEVEAQGREVDENRKKTRHILGIFQKDITFAECEIQRSALAPQGFPESEWRHIFKGEAVNLNVIFSNVHHIAPPKENVGCIRRTEISLGKTDPARKIQTSGNWTAAWHATTKATTYAFPH